MYTLYHFPHSQHARRVVSLLEEAQLEYQLKHVAMDKGEYLSPEYLAINPNHQVPTLLDDGVKIHESNGILRYLCYKHRLVNWYPDDLPRRALVEQWLDWNQCRLGPVVVDIVLNKVFMGDKGDLQAAALAEKKLPELASVLNQELEKKNYIAGDQPTIADLSLASNIFQLSYADAVPQLAEIESWFKRICALPGFQKSLPQP
ncbi:glutathione S-transferase family protein [Motiliproteus sp. MSK22-1]|uniref:glutathione S-transferase family protein n=1 Tax=Motiliproteus sp. MSK22-1 TaxID=1897630 RepID=UPI000976C427|nr:glutathione S-transferase family protein [Motiliproteus sp. MSK22-1]OMH32086.1 hypothetical protein BGP75_15385 [Motiliproteus sp. MSK22-1]